jgi:hypothetical protein
MHWRTHPPPVNGSRLASLGVGHRCHPFLRLKHIVDDALEDATALLSDLTQELLGPSLSTLHEAPGPVLISAVEGEKEFPQSGNVTVR